MASHPGEFTFNGGWGQAFDSAGNPLLDLVVVDTPVEIGRIDLPLVGTMRVAHKRGRETREGTMQVQKYDSRWEWFIYQLLSQSVDQQRAARDGKAAALVETFGLVLKVDDPKSLGVEKWQLSGCRIWRLPLGINSGDEALSREYPITWEEEKPLALFQAVKDGSGRVVPQYVVGSPS